MYKDMTIEQLEARKAEIMTELDKPEADLKALEEEARAIKEELEARKQAETDKEQIRQLVAAGAAKITKPVVAPAKSDEEIRGSKEYAEAYKNFVLTGDDSECRALLTTTASGTVPVPVIVDTAIRTAWENNAVTARLNRTFLRGNFKAAFERSADPAYEHTEGTTAPTEESLLIGIVELVPKNVKKWITISDEAVAMGGEEFLRYIYDEITYQIVKKVAALAINDIVTAGTDNTGSAIGLPKITEAPGQVTVTKAIAKLTDEAVNRVVVMNPETEPEFFAAYAGGNFDVDVMRGLTIVHTSALPAYSSASSNAVYMIVGDLRGEQINYPEGDGVVIKWDDLSLAEADLVKVVGRQYAGHGVTRPGCLVRVAKPAPATT